MRRQMFSNSYRLLLQLLGRAFPALLWAELKAPRPAKESAPSVPNSVFVWNQRFAANRVAGMDEKLPLQGIFYPWRSSFDNFSQFRLDFSQTLAHFPRDFTVAEMSFHTAAQPRDIFGLRKIHLEQEPGTG